MDSKKDDILHKNEERITRYLHGEMTSDEETLFEKDIQSDETLRNQTEAIARTIKAMNALGFEQDRKLVEEMRGSSKKDSTNALAFYCSKFCFAYFSRILYV